MLEVPVAAVPARRIARARRFPFGRLQRPDAVPLCRRPRQSRGSSERFDPLSAPVLRALKDIADKAQEARQAGGAVRRTRLAADRRAGAGDPRLSLAVAVALGGRPGQGACCSISIAARARARSCRCSSSRSAACRSASKLEGIRRGRRAAALDRRCRSSKLDALHRPATRDGAQQKRELCSPPRDLSASATTYVREAVARIRRARAGGRRHQGLSRRRQPRSPTSTR